MCGPDYQSSRFFMFVLCCAATFSVGWAQEPAVETEDVVFYAMGDVPYSAEDDVLLPRQLAELPDDGAFVVHVGDIKRGAVPCLSNVYEKVDHMLRQCQQPLFMILGDNEWNDCLIPAAAWELWKAHFMRFDQNWQHKFPVFRQLEREENFAFTHQGVLFLGINLVGGRVHDPAEWTLRHQQNTEWTKANFARCGKSIRAAVIFGHANPQPIHDDFFKALSAQARYFGKPVLYLHGDGHSWIHDKPFAAKNIQRVQVDQGGKAPPLRVTVTSSPLEPFHFDRRLSEQPGKQD